MPGLALAGKTKRGAKPKMVSVPYSPTLPMRMLSRPDSYELGFECAPYFHARIFARFFVLIYILILFGSRQAAFLHSAEPKLRNDKKITARRYR